MLPVRLLLCSEGHLRPLSFLYSRLHTSARQHEENASNGQFMTLSQRVRDRSNVARARSLFGGSDARVMPIVRSLAFSLKWLRPPGDLRNRRKDRNDYPPAAKPSWRLSVPSWQGSRRL